MQPPYKILLLDTKARNPNHYICLAIRDALAALGAEVHYARYEDAVRTAVEAECNVFLAFDGEEMHLDICRKLVSLCDFSVLWLTEDPYESPSNVATAQMFDLVYSNDLKSVSLYGVKGRHLPFAASTKFHFHEVLPESSPQLRYDVLFCGAAWPNRLRLLDPVLRALEGKRFKIGLVPVQPGSLPISLPPSSYMWRTPPTELARLANRSRITLALHRDFTTNRAGKAIASTPPPRLFEAALAGTLQFFDSRIAETANYFEPEKEVVSYDSPQDCIEKIRFYLSNPDQRYSIAKAAQLRASKEHTYNSRAQKILDDLKAAFAAPGLKRRGKMQRPRILFVTHNIRTTGHFGGVEVYQEELAEKLSERYDLFLYYRDKRKGPNTYVLTDASYKPLEEIRFDNESFSETLSVPIKESVFATLLEAYRIDLIHFQHLLNHPASLVLIARMLNIPVVLTLQDFWVMCDSHNLLDHRRGYCDIPNRPDSACDICVDARLSKPAGTQAIRRNVFRRVLANADAIIGNTEGFHNILARFFPELADSPRVKSIPLPLPQSDSGTALTTIRGATRPPRQGNLRVAVVGNFTYEKGAEAILRAVNQLRSAPVEFVIFGRVDAPYDAILTDLKFPNLTVYGQYHHADLAKLLKDMDLALHLSIWPETYCIALSESWHNGLVPIVTDVGALGERVINGENGWKIPPDQPAGLLDLLRRILANPELLTTVRERTASSTRLFESVSEHAAKIRDVYERLLSQPQHINGGLNPAKAQNSRLALFDAGIVFNQRTWNQTFEAYHEATSIVSWNVSSGNRYFSQRDRAMEIQTQSIPVGSPADLVILSGNGNQASDIHLQQLAARIELLERSNHQNRLQIEAIYQSRIWKALCASGDRVLRLQKAFRGVRR